MNSTNKYYDPKQFLNNENKIYTFYIGKRRKRRRFLDKFCRRIRKIKVRLREVL